MFKHVLLRGTYLYYKKAAKSLQYKIYVFMVYMVLYINISEANRDMALPTKKHAPSECRTEDAWPLNG
ncbi:hypothetical protein [Dictyobacter aurantiacus]|uniref:Uncharacterized protein n=1 Tax=Dictyobacter aurantiacus TaxID=1936993 RepID=A0A401ZK91_9CHLR|nr:hypothetical protein [Dictyobacter aurantiacus]GCE07287.1 hypothetical protein KDAU_46160 [Dictyobacter aurantiacus]